MTHMKKLLPELSVETEFAAGCQLFSFNGQSKNAKITVYIILLKPYTRVYYMRLAYTSFSDICESET